MSEDTGVTTRASCFLLPSPVLLYTSFDYIYPRANTKASLTEWNDILRAKGILPPKVEEQLTELVEAAVHERVHGKALEDRELDELDELEDIEDDRVL
eukprot:jgi/Hompol1/4521/HPOL_003692-RA